MNRIKILFLTANPVSTTQLAIDEEIRRITQKIRASKYQDNLELISCWAVRPDDLLQYFNEHKPQIVHFSGHGTKMGEIILVDSFGNPKPVSTNAIKTLFSVLKDNIRIVLLNACYSRIQAEAIAEVIDYVIGMNTSIGDEAAIIFAASFYRAIGFGRSLKKSFDQGITALLLEGISEENVPELLVKNGVEPDHDFLDNDSNSTVTLKKNIVSVNSSLEEQWALLNEKLMKLQKAKILENQASIIFQLEKQIEQTRFELQEMELLLNRYR